MNDELMHVFPLQAEAGGQRYVDSPAFYTDTGPYHVRLRLYPTGDGAGETSTKAVKMKFSLL